MISTYHGNGQKTVRGSTKPILIFDYNIMMGEVDKKDQLLAMYPTERKRTHGYPSSYAKLVLLELALYDVPVHSTVSLS